MASNGDDDKLDELIAECKRMGICYVCRAPVISGQALYGPRQAHYDCVTPTLPKYETGADLKELIRKGDESIAQLKRAAQAFDDSVRKQEDRIKFEMMTQRRR